MPVFVVTLSMKSNIFMVGSPHHCTVSILIATCPAMQHLDLSKLYYHSFAFMHSPRNDLKSLARAYHIPQGQRRNMHCTEEQSCYQMLPLVLLCAAQCCSPCPALSRRRAWTSVCVCQKNVPNSMFSHSSSSPDCKQTCPLTQPQLHWKLGNCSRE